LRFVRDAEPAADKRADHPVAVALVRERLLDDRSLDRIGHASQIDGHPSHRVLHDHHQHSHGSEAVQPGVVARHEGIHGYGW
jgi:hypothetical protein